jgi:ATP-dependent Clp protease adaptor protein ClpS
VTWVALKEVGASLTIIFAAETAIPDVKTTPDIDIEFVVMDDEELEKPYRVIIHNDDVTPIDFVITVLCTIFELNVRRATSITYEAHTTGTALVAVLPYEEAHRRVYNAQSAAREFGFPLAFTIEPDA